MSKRIKVQFPAAASEQDLQLNGLLELPSTSPTAFVLFAHCFTCGKDIAAASRIARALVARGFGVLRFDFISLILTSRQILLIWCQRLIFFVMNIKRRVF